MVALTHIQVCNIRRNEDVIPTNTETRQLLDVSGIWKFKLVGYKEHVDVSQALDTEYVMAVPGSYNDRGVIQSIRQRWRRLL